MSGIISNLIHKASETTHLAKLTAGLALLTLPSCVSPVGHSSAYQNGYSQPTLEGGFRNQAYPNGVPQPTVEGIFRNQAYPNGFPLPTLDGIFRNQAYPNGAPLPTLDGIFRNQAYPNGGTYYGNPRAIHRQQSCGPSAAYPNPTYHQ